MAAPQSTGPESTRPNAPLWIKILVGWHVLAITVWAMPNPSDAIMSKKVAPAGSDILLEFNVEHMKQFDPIRAYLFTTGTWQYWDMFSPNPVGKDVWADAEVVFKDGTSKIYLYPRIYTSSIPMKYERERYRKFFERVNDGNKTYFWPILGQFIAHQMDNPANPPTIVRLRRHFYDIPPMGTPIKYDYKQEQFYEYYVDQAKLRAQRGSDAK